MTKKNDENEVKEKEVMFGKEQLLIAKKYKDNRDLLWALLEDNKEYSHKQVEDIIKNFMEKEVE